MSSNQEPVTILSAESSLKLKPAQTLLELNGILAFIETESISTVYGGLMDSVIGGSGPRLVVPGEQIEQARQLLCENQIQCEVPGDAVERFLNRVITPAIQDEGRDRHEVLKLLERQTGDFCLEVFRQARDLDGGSFLLTSLLLASIRDSEGKSGESVRRDLAAALSDHYADAALEILGKSLDREKDAGSRTRMAWTIGRFRTKSAAKLLIDLLEDEDPDVREEAFDSLYFVSDGKSLGYDPMADEDRRSASVAKWRDWIDSRDTDR